MSTIFTRFVNPQEDFRRFSDGGAYLGLPLVYVPNYSRARTTTDKDFASLFSYQFQPRSGVDSLAKKRRTRLNLDA